MSGDTTDKTFELALRVIEMVVAETPSHHEALAALFTAFRAVAEQHPCCMHTSGVLCLQLGGRLVAGAPPDHPIH